MHTLGLCFSLMFSSVYLLLVGSLGRDTEKVFTHDKD